MCYNASRVLSKQKSLLFSLPFVSFALGLLILVSACGRETNKDKCSRPDGHPVEDVAAQDIASLSSFNSVGAIEFDRENNNTFSQVFGGTSGKHVSKFFSDRIETWAVGNPSDVFVFSANNLKYENWLKPKSSVKSAITEPAMVGSVLAFNLSPLLWIQMLLENHPYIVVYVKGETVSIQSIRDGLMVITENYPQYYQANQCDWKEVPQTERQAILIHEARHSDCTGGISVAELEILRSAENKEDAFTKFQNRRCGHLHVKCEHLPELKGVEACDRHAWGAHAVQSVFLGAAILNTQDQTAKQRLKSTFLEMMSRIDLPDSEKAVPPDMSSSGVYR